MLHSNPHTRSVQQAEFARHARADASLFFNLLTDDQLLDRVDALAPPHRERLFSPTTTMSMFIAQALSADGSCQAAVNGFAAARVAEELPACASATGGYCRARERLPQAMVEDLVRFTGTLTSAKQQPAWRGRNVKLVDGTTLSMPDTKLNQAAFPQPKSQQPGTGFPGLRLVAVLDLASGALLDTAVAPLQGKETGEMALMRTLLDTFEPGDIVVADRYYASYYLVAALIARGVDVLFEQHASRKTHIREGEDHIVEWQKPSKPEWMSPDEHAAVAPSLSIRELEVGHKVLVTTLCAKRSAPRKALGALFTQRWHVELDLRNIKSTLGMDILRCKCPEMALKEMWIYWLAYNLIRMLMAQAAHHCGCPSRQISFKHTVQVWLAWSVRFHLAFACSLEQREALYEFIASRSVGLRPGRVEPRAIKRRPKPYPLLNQPRDAAQQDIRLHGHPKKLK